MINSKVLERIDDGLRMIELTKNFKVSSVKLDGIKPHIIFKKKLLDGEVEEIKYTFLRKHLEKITIENIGDIISICKNNNKVDNSWNLINLNVNDSKIKGEYFNLENEIRITITINNFI